MYDVAICDDSVMDCCSLRERIRKNKEYGQLLRFHEYHSGESLLDAMNTIEFSIIFLDVEMDGIDGEETAERIRKTDDNVVLVFYTGYAEPSLHSIEVQPFRFIKKNMTGEEQDRYIDASLRKMADMADSYILVAQTDKKKLFIRADDIVYIEKYKKSTRAWISIAARKKYNLPDGRQLDIRISDKLINIYETLKKYGFGYPHDSYIINFKYLVSCGENELRLEGFEDIALKIARSKAVEFNRLKREFIIERYRGDRGI